MPALFLVKEPTGGGRIARFQRAEARPRPDQHFGAAIGEDVGDLGALQQRIDRHMDQPRTRCRQGQQAGRLAFCRPAGHAGALGKLGREPGGQASYTRS